MLNGQQVGPYKVQDIQGWIEAGYVQMEDAAWFAGCEAWIQVRDIPGIYEQTSSHSESKHLIPPFEHIQEICLLFLLVMHTRIQKEYLPKLRVCMNQVIKSGMMRV